MESLRIFIGYDSREPVAYHVLAHSILRRASLPYPITPLARTGLGDLYTRDPSADVVSTEFSFTRFLVPHLSDYRGYSLYMDCDMLVRVDLAELWTLVFDQPDKDVLVVPHDYVPKTTTKFLGQPQTAYPRKNWSSLMVFNNRLCRALTPAVVNTVSGLSLHRFEWLRNDGVGYLPLEWNWLVGEYAPNPDAKILHYTLGGPWFTGPNSPWMQDVDYDWNADSEWQEEFELMTYPADIW